MSCRAIGLNHIRTRPYTPRTNGKTERFIQMLCRECAYAMALQNSEERNRWRPRCLSIYNQLRKHAGFGSVLDNGLEFLNDRFDMNGSLPSSGRVQQHCDTLRSPSCFDS
ncbi:integrase core domain-containing protein [Synechococcus sp. RSCCF101]|uniref:integrase core domain-containing protein n=1 Tax=Synechococcus sp. RSCCF101 TaxID=2511069 RepID=UPI001CD93D21